MQNNRNPENKEVLDLLKAMISHVAEKQGISKDVMLSDVMLSVFNDEESSVPLSVFSTRIPPLESLVKFLREERNLSYAHIAKILDRDDRSIWSSYHNAIKKEKKRLSYKRGENIPLKIFRNRSLSVMENVIMYLKDNLSYSSSLISKKINRKQGTISATAYHARKKIRGMYK